MSIFLQALLLPLLAWSDNEGVRRSMFMAGLSTALLAIPLWGQREGRGAMAMGGMRGGYVAHSIGAYISVLLRPSRSSV